ncbi:MAG: hypothetical protein HYU70_07945 [Bacteroidetes bacterium]|nr:hypothetical protein [Bacteroidota bacterium]
MTHLQEKVLFHLTGKLSLAQVDPAIWQQLAAEAPYFAPARFFQAVTDTEHRTVTAQTANLYFTNPLWLSLQLGEITPVAQKDPVTAPPLQVPSVESVKEMMEKIKQQEITDLLDQEQEPEPDEYIEEADAVTETADADSKIAGILSSQLADFKKPVEADATLDIETEKRKLHTIDYFASQGIKIDLSTIPQDKLTAHLRKFTDWLKQVKNTQATHSQDLGTSLEMEKAVAETAKNSNETREILTETMADVLEKQGQIEKAIQLYIKLSFINPEKSSYFAAKIEQLKGI